MHNVFLDTSYAIALAVEQDQYHGQALRYNDKFAEDTVHVVTTRAVVVEIGNYLSSPLRRRATTAYLDSLERDPAVEVVPLSEALFRRGFDLYRSRSDKAWGLTDCISFIVMRERNMTEALTADHHFEQAGFKALLRTS